MKKHFVELKQSGLYQIVDNNSVYKIHEKYLQNTAQWKTSYDTRWHARTHMYGLHYSIISILHCLATT